MTTIIMSTLLLVLLHYYLILLSCPSGPVLERDEGPLDRGDRRGHAREGLLCIYIYIYICLYT